MNSNLRKLPDFTQLDLFAADFTDIATRMLQDVMWRPFFALSNKPRFEPIVYSSENVEIMIVGSKPFGIATVFDADILMWLISQVVEAKDKGEVPSPQVDFKPYDCLRGIRRDTGGRQYKLLMNALRRLHSTTVVTSIRKRDQTSLSKADTHILEAGFHWVEAYGVHRKEHNGKETIDGITAVLPNWIYRAVTNQKNVLTFDEDYLLLKSGLDRAFYMIARKHVGRQKYYSLTMEQLHEKTGSEMIFSHFCREARKRLQLNGLPEYFMMLSPKGCSTLSLGNNTKLQPHHTDPEVITFWNQKHLSRESFRLKLM